MTAKVMFSSGSKAWANNLNDLRERWRIRQEEPVEFVVPVTLFKQDIQNMERGILLKLKTDLIKLLNDGKKELLRHQNIKREEGVYLQADKYSDLFFTIKAIGVHVQEVNRVLGGAKSRVKTFPQVFMDICAERLSSELFDELIQEARRRTPSLTTRPRHAPAASVDADREEREI